MRISHYSTLLLLWSMSSFPACVKTHQAGKETPEQQGSGARTALSLHPGFKDYWYLGKAEITTYDVQQERYGAIRRAEQINVFVTEDFSRQKQVKLDDPAQAGGDRIPVLKLNALRRFHTGIYDYSLMQSVFTPVDGSPTLKTTCSIQDWCGHVFSQYNLHGPEYQVRAFSYFESEGDSDQKVSAANLLEDELWVRLRLNPDQLPHGKIQLIPSSFYLRMRHKPIVPHPAMVSIQKGQSDNTLSIQYEDIPRLLNIRFEPAPPYRILGWEETDGGKLMSKAERKASVMSPYWSQHDLEHDGLRDSLRLMF